MKIRHIVSTIILIGASLTACGGSSSSSSSDSIAEAAKSTQDATGGNSSSQFCMYAGLATGALNSAFADEQKISDEEFWKESLTAATQMVEGAPDEIKTDAGKVQAGIVAYTSFLANFGYDADKMAADTQTSAAVKMLNTDGSITAAGDAVNAYIDSNC